MTEKELTTKLGDMYFNAAKGEAATMIHLFGIKYATELQVQNIRDIVKGAGLYESYKTEVRKGMNLAKYVIPKF